MIAVHYTWAFAINFVIKFILSMQGKLSRLFCINLLISLLSPPCIRFVCNLAPDFFVCYDFGFFYRFSTDRSTPV